MSKQNQLLFMELSESLPVSQNTASVYVLMSSATPIVERQFMVPVRFTLFNDMLNVFVHDFPVVFRIKLADLMNQLADINERHQKVNRLADLLITYFIREQINANYRGLVPSTGDLMPSE